MKNPERKAWNQRQKKLRTALTGSIDLQEAIDLFLIQHAMLHSAEISPNELVSFSDEVWQDLSEKTARCIPPNGEHSIAWVIWHLARIEDVTMNLLVANSPQILHHWGWLEKLKVTAIHTGNAMTTDEIAELSQMINIQALRGYRKAVGIRTRAIVKQLQAEEMSQKVSPVRIEQLIKENAVLEEGMGVVDYWSKRTIAGLLLMPPTRHNFVHLNEAMRIKQKCQ